MPVTCKQIAEMVGVSRPAAASVLNHAKVCRVSPEKRDRILKLAEELHYVSSNVARTLVRGRSDTIGILTGGLHVYRVNQNLITLDGALREAGFLPVIVYTRSEYDAIAAGIRSLVRQGVDAVLSLGAGPSVMGPLCKNRLHQIIPTVFLDLDWIPDNEQINYVNFDYAPACDEMARYFRNRSVRRVHTFFYDSTRPSITPCQKELMRLKNEHALSFTTSWNIHRMDVLHPEKTVLSLYEDVYAELRAMKEPPDLLIFENTPCALASLPLLLERGWKIPDRVQIFSFSPNQAQESCLPVSTIHPDFRAFSIAVTRTLEKVIRQPESAPIAEMVPALFIPGEKKTAEPAAGCSISSKDHAKAIS